MGFTWSYSSPEGTVIDPAAAEDNPLPSPSFPTQADAESWIGETWAELLAGGVESVSLLEDGARKYGPMSLRPAP